MSINQIDPSKLLTGPRRLPSSIATVLLGICMPGLALAAGDLGNGVALPPGLSKADWRAIEAANSLAQQSYLKASNTDADDQFGISISVSGDTVVVGASGEASSATGVGGNQSNNAAGGSGAAYVFVRTGSGWTQQAYLKASNTDENDRFGSAVALSGDTLVVSAPDEDSSASGVNGNQTSDAATDAGAVYVFVRSGSSWTQQAYLKASNTDAGDAFGWSVAVADNTVLVGAYLEDSNAIGINGNSADNSLLQAGAVYAFVRSGNSWTQQAYIKSSNAGTADRFGGAVALDGDTAAIGAEQERSTATGVGGNQANNAAIDAGAAYVFVRNAGSWSQQAYIKASNTEARDRFGRTLALSGNTLVVGAPLEDSAALGINGNQADNSADESGAAYVFVRSAGSWSQQAYLKASNTNASDGFGSALSLAGDKLVIGAPFEESSAVGVDGNQSDNSAFGAGAAFAFARSSSTWSQQSYIKASNTEANDAFGVALGVTGDTVLITSVGEASNATGVNGNQTNNAAAFAGAAYGFVATATIFASGFEGN